MTFNLHFLGIAAANWPAAHQFYGEPLGMATADLNPTYGNWALMGRDHESYYNTHSVLKFELFDFGKIPTGGWEWGRTQGYRPSIYVDNLEQGIKTSADRGIEFSGEIESTRWGRRIEFKAHEGLLWTLEEAPELLRGNGFEQPNIGSVSLKASDLAAQRAFYHGLLGMQVIHEDAQVIALQRQAGEPYLFLEPGGKKMQLGYKSAEEQLRALGVWISFSVEDIESAASMLRNAGVGILQDVTTHLDWGGKDMLICDPDNNMMQVVQYLD